MSSKKIQVKVNIDEDVIAKFRQEAQNESRTKSSMMEKILKDRYRLGWGQGEEKHAEQE